MGEQLEKKGPQQGHKPWGIVWIRCLALLVYVLSIGPMAQFGPSGSSAAPALRALYFPALFLAQHSLPVHNFLDWYIPRIWRVPPLDSSTGLRSSSCVVKSLGPISPP